MTSNKNDIYSEFAQDWEEKAANELSPRQNSLFLEKALHIVIQRALQTLSPVTLMVVLDRVLHQSAEKFPVLSKVKIDDNNFNFNDLLHNDENHVSKDELAALRYLLVELLKVLGRITADVLTAPLREELLKMTWKKSEEK